MRWHTHRALPSVSAVSVLSTREPLPRSGSASLTISAENTSDGEPQQTFGSASFALRLKSFDLDLLLRLHSLGLLWKCDREHAPLGARLDLVGVDAFRHCELALERAEMAFTEIIILLLILLLLFLLFAPRSLGYR